MKMSRDMKDVMSYVNTRVSYVTYIYESCHARDMTQDIWRSHVLRTRMSHDTYRCNVYMLHTRVCMYVRTHVCVHVHTHVCMYVTYLTHTLFHTHVCMYVRTHVCMYVHTHVCMYVTYMTHILVTCICYTHTHVTYTCHVYNITHTNES